MNWITASLFLIILWGFLAWLQKVRRQIRKDPYHTVKRIGVIENEYEYVRAHEEMDRRKASEGQEMVKLTQVSSAEGFRDTDVLEWIAVLGSRGFEASYHVVYAEGIHVYTVKVPKGLLEEARQVLAEVQGASTRSQKDSS